MIFFAFPVSLQQKAPLPLKGYKFRVYGPQASFTCYEACARLDRGPGGNRTRGQPDQISTASQWPNLSVEFSRNGLPVRVVTLTNIKDRFPSTPSSPFIPVGSQQRWPVSPARRYPTLKDQPREFPRRQFTAHGACVSDSGWNDIFMTAPRIVRILVIYASLALQAMTKEPDGSWG
jgi:hypothetical protein